MIGIIIGAGFLLFSFFEIQDAIKFDPRPSGLGC